MKPLSIADYLDHLGRAAGERVPAQRETSPFRPRSLPSAQKSTAVSSVLSDRVASAAGDRDTQGKEALRRTPWAPKPVLLEPTTREAAPTGEPAAPEDMAAKLADAYARGREQGLAEARAEASDRHEADLAAARELAETQQREFRLKEFAELEGAIRSGFKQIEDNIGGAVARILAPFLSQQVVKRAVDELAKAIARACAGKSSGSIKIRGPEPMLALLRQRIADLPIEMEYVEDDRVETVVEANSTQIVSDLRPWAELLVPFEA
jgi:hypothetical protein